MTNYKFTIEYDGSAFVGWQWQNNGYSVQEAVEKALFSCTGSTERLACAGRTDAGVHALGQVASIKLANHWQPWRLREALNSLLRPSPVAVVAVEIVPDEFNARFSAKRRHYRYSILNRRAPATLSRHYAWHVKQKLDLEAMQQGANHLLGHHDFTTFRASQCQAASPVRTLEKLDISCEMEEEITFEVGAQSFLHNQVRSMVGSLKMVGQGLRPPHWIRDILEMRSRKSCGEVAPAHGLCLMKVDYM